MKRWLKWGVAVVALAVFGALVARSLAARKAQQARLATAPAAQAFELTRADVLTLAPVELVRTVQVSGGLKAVDSAVVKARVAAVVQEITVREGDIVKRGQLLGRLDTSEVGLRLRQADEQAAAAQSQLDLAERTLANNRALVAQGFISQNALDTSVMNAAGARASLQAAQAAAGLARKSLDDAQIRAPLDGIVSQRLVQPGERVALDARLLEIVDLSRIELEAAVSADDIGAVRIGSSARLQVDGMAEPVAAHVARINPSTQPGTRAVLVYLELEPHPALRQGLFARGAIELERRGTLAVPQFAVRIDQPRPYVFVVADGRIAQRDVTLGARGVADFGAQRMEAVEVKSGLAAGELLLRGNVGNLPGGTPVRLAPAAAPAAASAPALVAASDRR
ncbi:MAG TPA: efflux RND transporter periplasmic adaptor subunit [Burkholderiaceae bacterium]|jgi:RND family efflux transporter MFP subunit|nr:efflux RND transporter periplasmic adaptor subunit [Burkholderiaceae bacterium]